MASFISLIETIFLVGFPWERKHHKQNVKAQLNTTVLKAIKPLTASLESSAISYRLYFHHLQA